MPTEKTIAEITVSANYKTFRQYFIYSSMQRGLPWVNWTLIFAIAPAYELFLALRMITSRQPFSIILVLLLGFNLLGAAYLLLEPRILYRRRAKEWDAAPRTYLFEEERFLSRSEKGGRDAEGKEDEVIAYDAVQRASETRTAFFLEIVDKKTQGSACIALPKQSIGSMEVLALRKLFTETLGERFSASFR